MIDQKLCVIKNPICDMVDGFQCSTCENNILNEKHITEGTPIKIDDCNSYVSLDYEGMKNARDPLYRLLYEYGERIKKLEKDLSITQEVINDLIDRLRQNNI